MKQKRILLLPITALIVWAGCTRKENHNSLWIYTSIYKDVIAQMEPLLESQFPGVEFKWYQSGSENVAARLSAELSAGGSSADLVMTSDPLWYLELKKAGHLLSYHSPQEARINPAFRDSDGAFSIARIPVMVIGYNTEAISPADAPKSWSDLTNPKWKAKVSVGSPMESGTSFLTAIQLVRKKGWPYFQELRKNELMIAGGNSAVVSRIESKERPIGICLLENILEAQKRGSPISAIYPEEGVVLIPSPVAILARSKNPELAKRVYNFFLSDGMQKIIVHQGRMYSPVLPDEAPAGGRSFSALLATAIEWNPKVLEQLFQDRDEVKKKFMETILY